MNDHLMLEPARSFDVGTYIWAIGASFVGPELQAIRSLASHLNDKTIRFGAEHIERKFEEEIKAMEDDHAQQFEPFNPQA